MSFPSFHFLLLFCEIFATGFIFSYVLVAFFFFCSLVPPTFSITVKGVYHELQPGPSNGASAGLHLGAAAAAASPPPPAQGGGGARIERSFHRSLLLLPQPSAEVLFSPFLPSFAPLSVQFSVLSILITLLPEVQQILFRSGHSPTSSSASSCAFVFLIPHVVAVRHHQRSALRWIRLFFMLFLLRLRDSRPSPIQEEHATQTLLFNTCTQVGRVLARKKH